MEEGNAERRKRVRIAIEAHHEPPIERFLADGREERPPELSSTEVVQQFVRLMEASHNDVEGSRSVPSSHGKPPLPFAEPLEQLKCAKAEIDQLFDIITLHQQGEVVELQSVPMPEPSIGARTQDAIICVYQKRDQLRTAASILRNGADTARLALAKDRSFFEDLIELRKRWKLRPVPNPASFGLPDRNIALAVDYGFRTEGSAFPVVSEVPLERTATGHLSVVVVPPVQTLRDWEVSFSVDGVGHRREDTPHEQHGEPGVLSSSRELRSLQDSLFSLEVFERLVSDAIEGTALTVRRLQDCEVVAEYLPDHELRVEFRRRCGEKAGESTKATTTTTTHKDGSPLGTTARRELSWVLMILAQRLLRARHNKALLRRMKGYLQYPTTPPMGILPFLSSVIRHAHTSTEVAKALDDLARKHPQLRVLWKYTEDPCISSISIGVGDSKVEITLHQNEIHILSILPSRTSSMIVFEVLDLVNYIVTLLGVNTMKELSQVGSFFPTWKAKWDLGMKLQLESGRGNGTMCSLECTTTEDHSLTMTVRVVKRDTTEVVNWENVEGRNHAERLRCLLARLSSESFTQTK